MHYGSRILFNDEDVTNAPTADRNIAQVFQFPVVYDTMTVRDNLAPRKDKTAPPTNGGAAGIRT